MFPKKASSQEAFTSISISLSRALLALIVLPIVSSCQFSVNNNSALSKSSSSSATSPVSTPIIYLVPKDPVKTTSITFTPSHCNGISKIFASESNTIPLATDSAWQNCKTSSGSLSYTVSSVNGPKTVYFWAKNNDESVSTEPTSLTFNLDTTGPKVKFGNTPTAGITLKGGSTFSLSWSVLQNGAPVQSIDVLYAANGTDFTSLSSFQTTDTAYTWTLPSDSVSTATLKLKAIDITGNMSEVNSDVFAIDSTFPSLSWTPPTAAGTYASGNVFSLIYTAADGENSLASVKLQYASDGNTFSDFASLSSNPYSWTIPIDNTATAKLKLIVTDQVGNQASLTSSAFSIDAVPPPIPSVALTSANPTNSNSASFTVSSCADSAGIYISESSAKPSSSAAGWISCTTAVGGTPWTLSAGNGTKTIYFWNKDTAGNVSASSASVSITFNATAPGAPSVTLTSSSPTSSTASTYTVSSCTNIAGIYISESATPPAAGAGGWSTCTTNPSATTHTLSAGDGVKSVYFYAKDFTNNVSASTLINVTLDQTLPGVPSVSLASSNPASSTAATFTVASCTDRAAIYGSSSTTTPAANAPAWQTCSQTAGATTFTLPSGDGAKSVYFWAKDLAGNISATYATVNVTLDTTAPILAITSPTLINSFINNANKAALTVSGSCSENGQVVSVTATDTSSTIVNSAPTCNTGASPNWTTALNVTSLVDGTVTLAASQTDTAGNIKNATNVIVTKDTSNPTIAILAPAAASSVNNSGKTAVLVTGNCSENGGTVSITATDASAQVVSSTAACNTALTPKWSALLNFSSLNDGAITIAVSHTDTVSNSATANVAVTLDSGNPADATGLGWIQASPSTSNSVTARWTPSVAGDLASQTIQYYSDGTCTTASGSASSAGVLSTKAFAGTSGTWSYKITSVDTAGNTATSGCSSSIVLKEASQANSVITVSSANIKKGQTSTVTLTIKDPSGVQNTIGGYTVNFSASAGAGISTGTFSAVTDNNNGTYTATFTATAKGTATTIGATITGLGAVTSTGPTITVTNTAPSLAALSNRVLPIDTGTAWLQGNTNTITLTGTDTDGDSLTYSCTYQSLGVGATDANYAPSGTNCTSLPSLVTTNSTVVKGTASISGNVFTWIPTSTQRGTFQFSFTASDGSDTSSAQTVIVTVKANDTTSKLLSALDAQFSTNASGLASSIPSAPLPFISSPGDWLNLISTAANVSLASFGSSNPWSGGGTSGNPYSLNFNSIYTDSMSLSTVLNGSTKFAWEGWVKPSSTSTAGSVISSNGGGSGDGFVIRQSTTPLGRADFVIGKKYYSYRDLILKDNPVGYWRLNEAAGTTAADLSAHGNNGTYTGGYTLNQTGAGSSSVTSNIATSFDGSTGYVSIPDSSSLQFGNGSTISLELWAKPASLVPLDNATYQSLIVKGQNAGSTDANYGLRFNGNRLEFYYRNTGDTAYHLNLNSYTFTAGQWYHIVVNYTFGTGNSLALYVNGTLQSGVWTVGNGNVAPISTTNPAHIGRVGSGQYFSGLIGDVGIYNSALSSTQITEHYQTGLNGNYKTYPGNAVLADRPIGYWRLGEKSGNIAYDSSGNNYDATYTSPISRNEAGAISNDSNGSAFFNGTGTSIDAGNITALNSLRQTTVEAWVKTTALTQWAGLVERTFSTANRIFMGSAGSSYGGGSQDAWISFANGSSSHWAYTTTNVITTGVWQHWVAVFNGYGATNADRVKFYINGVQQTLTINASPTTLGTNATSLIIGGVSGSWKGYIDEVAIYNYALSPTQIAAHYNTGLGAGWWTCQSLTALNSSTWNLLSAIYDGTTSKLFVNGQEECSVTPGTTYSGAVANTRVGADTTPTNYWSGALSWLRIFGTSDGTAPASSSTVATDFTGTANRFRIQPQENIVTNGLVSNFDAANANQGIKPYTTGCASSDLNWRDLSTSLYNGTLWNFGSCGPTTGWVGSGIVSSPYALAFDGINDYVNLSKMTGLGSGLATGVTLSGWIKTSNTTAIMYLFGTINTGTTTMLGVGLNVDHNNVLMSGSIRAFLRDEIPLASGGATNSASSINDGNWHHVAYVITPAGPSQLRLYLDGVSQTFTYSNSTAPSNFIDFGFPAVLGALNNRGTLQNYFSGSIANFQIYNRGLSAQEVKQNCLAQEGRFTATAQSICGAP